MRANAMNPSGWELRREKHGAATLQAMPGGWGVIL